MADHALNFGIYQFLGSSSALFWIGSIVFSQQFELDNFVTNFDARRIQFFNGHLGAIFVVLAQVGNGTAGRSNVTNFDDLSATIFFATGNECQNNCGHCNRCERGLKRRQFHE